MKVFAARWQSWKRGRQTFLELGQVVPERRKVFVARLQSWNCDREDLVGGLPARTWRKKVFWG
jgi:hypothetical protein